MFINSRKILFIEAKSLSQNIRSRDNISQLARYSFDEGLKWGVLTNGASWLLFRTFKEDVGVMDRIVWSIDLEKDDLKSAIRQLATISKDRIDQIEILINKNQKLEEVWKDLLDDKTKLVQSLVMVMKNEVESASPEYQFEEDEVTNFVDENVNQLLKPSQEVIAPIPEYEQYTRVPSSPKSPPKVSELRIGNQRYKISKHKQILEIVANWLIEQGKLRQESIPKSIKNFLNEDGRRPDGRSFREPKKLRNGLITEIALGYPHYEIRARKMLKVFGYPENMLEIK